MFRMLSATVVALAMMLGTSARAQTLPTPGDKPIRVTFLHVNDIHGHIDQYNINGHSVGGYPRLASAVQAARAEKSADRIFLIHAGDEFSRGDALTTSTKGAANVALMNQIGFDLWTPGNGEFYGGLGLLKQRFSEFRGQTLSANLYSRLDGELLFKPYIIQEVRGLRIAFFSVNFIDEQHPACLLIRMENPIETAKKLVPQLRQQADFVVAVTHIGLDADRQLAQSVDGIDLIIGGHSHSVLPSGTATKSPGGQDVVIAQAGEYLNYLGRVDLEVARTADGWEIQTLAPTLTKLDEKVQIDPTVKATIAKLSATTRDATPQPVPAGQVN